MKRPINKREKPTGWLTICFQGKQPLSIWIANIKVVKKQLQKNAKKAGLKVEIFINKNHGFPTEDKLRGLKLG